MKKVIPVNLELDLIERTKIYMYDNRLYSRSAFIADVITKYLDEFETDNEWGLTPDIK